MIFDDGLVYDVLVKNKSLHDMNLLMKLPKSEHHFADPYYADPYFGYSDDNGVIYFIHSDTEKFITKYHKSFNSKGHITVQKSKRYKALMQEIVSPAVWSPGLKFQYNHGVLMGNRFWTFGGYTNIKFAGTQVKFDSRIQSNQTTIWSTKRQVWIRGPDLITKSNCLDTNILNYKSMNYDTLFTSVINSTTIILIGGCTVVCFNIAAKDWTYYPDFPLYADPFIEMATPTVTFDKNGKRYVYISRKHFNSKFHL